MQRLAILYAATLWLAGCTWTVDMRPDDDESDQTAAEPFFVEAELFYPERIALPGDAEMLVAVDTVSRNGRVTLTRFSTKLEGRQVPIPLGFSVEPEGENGAIYELSAAILSGDRLLRLTGPVLVQPEAGHARPGQVRLRSPLETGFGQAWQCGPSRLLFGAIDERAFLALDGRLHAVGAVPADSGVRYRSQSDPQLGIDEREGEILLVHGEDEATGCRRVEPLEPPLSGGGNEPGWHIEIGSERIELTSDYGQTVTEAALIHTGSSGRTTRFRGLGENGAVLAAFNRRVCRDSATGMPHPFVLEVQFEGGTLSGCGGRPRDLLVSKQWRVDRLGGQPIPAGEEDEAPIEITLRFDDQGRVSGSAACNRYQAGYELGGEGLSIDTPAATEMACPAPRMQLEARFLKLLAEVQRFDIDREGVLVLIGPEGRISAVPEDR